MERMWSKVVQLECGVRMWSVGTIGWLQIILIRNIGLEKRYNRPKRVGRSTACDSG